MKKTIQLFSLIVLSLLFIYGSPVKKQRVVIDAGHGGVDNGVVVSSILEKELTLNIANRIKELNPNDNIEIILLRDDDKFISLGERVKRVNELKPDLLISLHYNAEVKGDENGVEIYVGVDNSKNEMSRKEAEKIFAAYPEKLNKRGVKEANFLILNKSNCPSILIELGFLTNKNDLSYLLSDNGRDEIAKSIIEAINN